MQLIKKIFLGFIFFNFCFLIFSCAKKNQIVKSAIDTAVAQEAQIKLNTKVVNDLAALLDSKNTGLFAIIVRTQHAETLADILQVKPRSNLTQMVQLAKDIAKAIAAVNAPVVNKKIAEVQQLIDAETDPALIARYQAIIKRMRASSKTVIVDIENLKLKTNAAITNIQGTQRWISSRSTGEFKVREKAWEDAFKIEVALTTLSAKLDAL